MVKKRNEWYFPIFLFLFIWSEMSRNAKKMFALLTIPPFWPRLEKSLFFPKNENLFYNLHFFISLRRVEQIQGDNLTNIITISIPRDGLRIVWESIHLARENCRLAFVDQFCLFYINKPKKLS